MKSSRYWKIRTVEGKETYGRSNYEVTVDSFKSVLCDLAKEVIPISREEYVKATGDDDD
ncbi:MAG: hypothetical protein ACLUU0_11690 [Anaerostipes hadrus]